MEMLKKDLVHMANMVASFDFINIDPQHRLQHTQILIPWPKVFVDTF